MTEITSRNTAPATFPLATIVEPSTGAVIDLTGLSPEERLYCLIETYVDPSRYDGWDGEDCMIGQPAEYLADERPELLDLIGRNRDSFEVCTFMSKLTGVEQAVVEKIFEQSVWDKYCLDFYAAKAMARDVLGLPE